MDASKSTVLNTSKMVARGDGDGAAMKLNAGDARHGGTWIDDLGSDASRGHKDMPGI